MTEVRLGPRIFLLFIAVGLMVGIVIGLGIARLMLRPQVAKVEISDLSSSAQDDYVVLTASTYAYDNDLERARERLALLKDPQILDRMDNLVKALEGNKRLDAVYVARLAAAIGSDDSTVMALAATSTPTATPTLVPTNTPTEPPAITTSTLEKSVPTRSASTSLKTPTRTPTRRPTPKPTQPPAPPIAPPVWIPSFPSEWPGGTNYQPVNVAALAPGQEFWHLSRAQYCDVDDPRNNCPNLPGGSTGTNIYITLVDAGGNRISGTLIVRKDDGSLAGVNDLGPQKSATDMCACNYSYLANHWPIQIAGAPSDTVSGLGLYSVRERRPQAHTRYYLTFQLLTR
ncbi:MAG: hypothetical protein M1132_04985 [Chloroflexi bacterium]|nr:hypothetical protein [Chloroflexota bacterium]